MDELVIDIGAQGKVEALHFDEFDLGFLGEKKISRASEIHFNEDTQLWDIILPGLSKPNTMAVQGFKSYNIARGFEVEWLQGCRKAQVSAYDRPGCCIAHDLRFGASYA